MQGLLLKQGLLLFWAVWLSITCVANFCDGLKALKLISTRWRFASGNYAFLVATTQKYHPTPWLPARLFLGVILWQGLAALLFWRAVGMFTGMQLPGLHAMHTAFVGSLALWAAFMIADEIVLAYEAETTHMRIFIAQLLSLLVLHLLPDRL